MIHTYVYIHVCIFVFDLSRVCKVLYALRAWARYFSRTTRTDLFNSLTREERSFYLRALRHLSGRPVESRGIRFSRSPRALRDLITCSFALAHGYANRSVRVSRNENARSRLLRPLFSHLVSSFAGIFHRTKFRRAPIIRLKLVVPIAIIARIFQLNHLISRKACNQKSAKVRGNLRRTTYVVKNR